MAKKRSTLARRTWSLLRLALLMRKGGDQLKRGLLLGLRIHMKKTLRGENKIGYLQREFSFDETPVFHLKLHRPASKRLLRIPCINPPTNFDDDDDEAFFRRSQASPVSETAAKEDFVVDDGSENGDCGLDNPVLCIGEEGGGIDAKAEEFIARFYAEMKLQRQVSWLQYNEMLQRGAS